MPRKPKDNIPDGEDTGEPIEEGKTYTALQFLYCIKVSKPTFYRWLSERNLRAFSSTIGDKWFITGAQFTRWVESQSGKDAVDDLDIHGTPDGDG